LASILTFVAVVLVALGAARPGEKNPVLMLAGLVLGAISLPMHFVAQSTPIMSLAAMALSTGLGFLLGASILAARKQPSQPFLVLAVLCLFTAFALRTPAYLSNRFATESVDEVHASILVELGPDDSIDEIADVLSEFDATAERAFPSVSLADDEDLSQTYLVTGIKRDLLRRLLDLLRRQLDDVDFAEVNEEVGLLPPALTYDRLTPITGTFAANDPMIERQWAVSAVGLDAAHRLLDDATPARKAIVAILDTGVDAAHEDITGIYLSDSPGNRDAHGHGTHCAGIAGAATNNGKGIASLNWEGRFVDIASYQALGDTGFGSLESIAQAIIDATTDGADVISMSLGEFTPLPPRVVIKAVEFALQRDVIVVAAAGNSNQDATLHMPSNIPGVIAVAAVDEQGRKASFSNINTRLSRPIAAPGVNILSLEPGGRYGLKSGTSMATPLVAGLIGVMRSLNPEVTAEEAYEILRDTGTDGPDVSSTGRTIQADEALLRVAIRPIPLDDEMVAKAGTASSAAVDASSNASR
jgi:thermitase